MVFLPGKACPDMVRLVVSKRENILCKLRLFMLVNII